MPASGAHSLPRSSNGLERSSPALRALLSSGSRKSGRLAKNDCDTGTRCGAGLAFFVHVMHAAADVRVGDQVVVDLNIGYPVRGHDDADAG